MLIGRILLKQVFYQDVRQDVMTCWYDIVAYLVLHSWMFYFLCEISEDSMKI